MKKRVFALVMTLALAVSLCAQAAGIMHLPENVVDIPEEAFYGDQSLTQVYLGDNTETIGKRAFMGTGLESIQFPRSLVSIGDEAFYNVNTLSDVYIQSGIETIGARAFAGTGLESMLELPSTLKTIGAQAFEKVKTVTHLIINEGTQTIGSKAFSGTSLKKVAVPGSATSIASDAFDAASGAIAYAPKDSAAYSLLKSKGYRMAYEDGATYSLNLDKGILWLDTGTMVGDKIKLSIETLGNYYVSFSQRPGTTTSWLSQAYGEGDEHTVVLRVNSVPASTGSNRFTTPDTFASDVTVECHGAKLTFTVAMAKSGPFVAKHVNTGNYAEDIIAVALTQEGYRGGANKNDLDGTNASATHNDWTKYGLYMGINGNPWGASFLSWCAMQAAIPTGTLTRTTWARPHGFTPPVKYGAPVVYYFSYASGGRVDNYPYLTQSFEQKYGGPRKLDRTNPAVTPKRGDFIFYGWSGSDQLKNVGLVLSYSGTTITYIDGNGKDEKDVVTIRQMDITDPYFICFYTPWP